MTFKHAQEVEKKTTAKRFWLTMTNGNGTHLYECTSKIICGTMCHFKRFAGWKDTGEKAIRCSTKGKKWELFWLASELTRTDWRTQLISNEIKNLLTQRDNYHKIYKA